MFEITVAGKVYPFHFGMGFMREINKKVGTTIDGLPDVKKNMGLQYHVAGILTAILKPLWRCWTPQTRARSPESPVICLTVTLMILTRTSKSFLKMSWIF